LYRLGIVNGESKIVETLLDRKDVYSGIAYNFGSGGFSGLFAENDSTQTEPLKDYSLSIGGFTYIGNEMKSGNSGTTYNNDFTRYGFNAQMAFNRINVF
jgi:hypothetical protein